MSNDVIRPKEDRPDLRYLVAMDPPGPFSLVFDIFDAQLGPNGPEAGDHIVHGEVSYKGLMEWDVITGPIDFRGPNDIEQFAGCFHAVRRAAAEGILNWLGERLIITGSN